MFMNTSKHSQENRDKGFNVDPLKAAMKIEFLQSFAWGHPCSAFLQKNRTASCQLGMYIITEVDGCSSTHIAPMAQASNARMDDLAASKVPICTYSRGASRQLSGTAMLLP